ncbi:MAG TPA: cation diffusion facilitator family transporter [Longimicrobiales bacterium]
MRPRGNDGCIMEPQSHCRLAAPHQDAATAHAHGAHHYTAHEVHGAHGGHEHHHHRAVGRRALQFVAGLTAAVMAIEFVGGWLADSLALMADAGHMLTDVAALSLSLFALWFARRPAAPEKTYGYLRWEILAALLNGATLIALSFVIFFEAYQRFRAPMPVQSGLMLAVALGGLAANILAAVVLHRSAGHSLNVRGAYLHVLGDLLGSAGAVAAALLIMATGWSYADPLISVVVGFLILASSWKLVRESVDVLLEAAPAHIDLAEVRRAIDEIDDVDDVHDLHVWTVTSGLLAMSGHAVVRDPRQNQRVLEEIHARLGARFGIRHITVQLEPGTAGTLGGTA